MKGDEHLDVLDHPVLLLLERHHLVVALLVLGLEALQLALQRVHARVDAAW